MAEERDVTVTFASSASRRRVLQQHAALRKIGTNAVGGRKIAAPFGGLPLFDQPVDFFNRHRWLIVFPLPQRQHAEHAIELVERLPDDRQIAGAELRRHRAPNSDRRTRSNIAPSAAAVFKSCIIASANAAAGLLDARR